MKKPTRTVELSEEDHATVLYSLSLRWQELTDRENEETLDAAEKVAALRERISNAESS